MGLMPMEVEFLIGEIVMAASQGLEIGVQHRKPKAGTPMDRALMRHGRTIPSCVT